VGLSRIFWDTNLFIYLLEGTGDSFQLARKLLERMVERRDELLTSALTLGEVLVKPLEIGRSDLAERYERLLDSPGVRIVPFGREGARIYARIRQDRSIRPPDAIQLSCAAAAGTDLFVTNDARLSRKSVPGVQFIAPLPQVFL
jgi:predicted nucleic acid-binding protein